MTEITAPKVAPMTTLELARLAIWAGICFLTAPTLHAQRYWPQFRGPNSQGVAETANPPIHFSLSSNIVWSAETPSGHSSPCVWGQRIFLTTFEAGKLETQGYHRTTGRRLWKQTAPAETIEKVQPFNSPASSTPVAEAGRVIVYFSTYGALCYNHDGKELWRQPLPTPKNQYGAASSLLLYRDWVVLLLDSDDKNSKLIALRADNGKMAWQTARSEFSANWSTPIIWEHDEQKDLVVLGSRRLMAYDPNTGKERWWVDGFSPETIGVPVFGDGLLFVSAANRTGGHTDRYQGILWSQVLELDKNADNKVQRSEVPNDYPWLMRSGLPKDNPGYAAGSLLSRFPSIDTDKDGAITETEWDTYARQWGARFAPSLKAIQPGGSGDLTTSHLAWQLHRGIPEIPSLLFYQGRLYLVRDGGLVVCLRPATGEVIYEGRLGASGVYCASPVAAGGRIYFASHSGTIVVIDATADLLNVLARNEVEEKIWATPALAEDTIYVRTERNLYACADRIRGRTTATYYMYGNNEIPVFPRRP